MQLFASSNRVMAGTPTHRFWVAIHHDSFIASIAEAERGVAAAVVKLNALTDAVRAATKNQHFLVGGWPGFTEACRNSEGAVSG